MFIIGFSMEYWFFFIDFDAWMGIAFAIRAGVSDMFGVFAFRDSSVGF